MMKGTDSERNAPAWPIRPSIAMQPGSGLPGGHPWNVLKEDSSDSVSM